MDKSYDKVSMEEIKRVSKEISNRVRSNFNGNMKGNCGSASARMSVRMENKFEKAYGKDIFVGEAETWLNGNRSDNASENHFFNVISPLNITNSNIKQPIIIDCSADQFCDKNCEEYIGMSFSFGKKSNIDNCLILTSGSQKYKYYGPINTWASYQSELPGSW